MEDILKNPFMKAVAGGLIDLVGVSIFFTALVMSTEVNGATKKGNKVPTQSDASSSYEDHKKECLRKRSAQRCEMLIEARKNLDDAKRLATPAQ